MTAVFNKAFRDSRRSLMWLIIGWGLYIALLMAFFPTIVEQAEDFDKMIRSMPRGITGMFVSGDIDTFSVADPAQFLQVRYASFVILLVGTLAIAQAFSAVLNAERDGTLDVMLSLPVSRRRYLLGRMANTAIMILAVLVSSLVILGAFTVLIPEFDIALGDLTIAIMAGFFPLAVTATFAYMLSVLVPSSKNYAGGIAYLMLIGSYLVHGFAASVPELEAIRPLLLFDYYNVAEIINDGLPLVDMLILSAAALVYGGIAWWYIARKELGV